MEAPSVFGVPISTMSPRFVLSSPLGPRFLMAAGSQHCVWGWPGPAACVQGVGYSIDVHYCIQNRQAQSHLSLRLKAEVTGTRRTELSAKRGFEATGTGPCPSVGDGGSPHQSTRQSGRTQFTPLTPAGWGISKGRDNLSFLSRWFLTTA